MNNKSKEARMNSLSREEISSESSEEDSLYNGRDFVKKPGYVVKCSLKKNKKKQKNILNNQRETVLMLNSNLPKSERKTRSQNKKTQEEFLSQEKWEDNDNRRFINNHDSNVPANIFKTEKVYFVDDQTINSQPLTNNFFHQSFFFRIQNYEQTQNNFVAWQGQPLLSSNISSAQIEQNKLFNVTKSENKNYFSFGQDKSHILQNQKIFETNRQNNQSEVNNFMFWAGLRNPVPSQNAQFVNSIKGFFFQHNKNFQKTNITELEKKIDSLQNQKSLDTNFQNGQLKPKTFQPKIIQQNLINVEHQTINVQNSTTNLTLRSGGEQNVSQNQIFSDPITSSQNNIIYQNLQQKNDEKKKTKKDILIQGGEDHLIIQNLNKDFEKAKKEHDHIFNTASERINLNPKIKVCPIMQKNVENIFQEAFNSLAKNEIPEGVNCNNLFLKSNEKAIFYITEKKKKNYIEEDQSFRKLMRGIIGEHNRSKEGFAKSKNFLPPKFKRQKKIHKYSDKYSLSKYHWVQGMIRNNENANKFLHNFIDVIDCAEGKKLNFFEMPYVIVCLSYINIALKESSVDLVLNRKNIFEKFFSKEEYYSLIKDQDKKMAERKEEKKYEIESLYGRLGYLTEKFLTDLQKKKCSIKTSNDKKILGQDEQKYSDSLEKIMKNIEEIKKMYEELPDLVSNKENEDYKKQIFHRLQLNEKLYEISKRIREIKKFLYVYG